MKTYKEAVWWAIANESRAVFYEPWIAMDPRLAFLYAKHVLHERFLEAETAISNSEFKSAYLNLFPEAKDDWAMNGWIGWIDT